MALISFAELGRLHPLVLHLPIGFLLAALWLEVLATRGSLARPALARFLWLAAGSAVVAAATGWVLGHEDGYGGATFERHQQLGIALAIAGVLAALLHPRSGVGARLSFYRVALLVACALLVPAGHLGATLTHGSAWLEGPRASGSLPLEADAEGAPGSTEAEATRPGEAPRESTGRAAARATYLSTFSFVFESYCTDCHGYDKHKGGLRLDSYSALMAGGDDGPALVPGDPAASLLLERVELPLEHEEHMPPEGKPQPTAAELAALEAWIADGAPFRAEAAPPEPPAPAEPVPDAEERDASLESAPGTPAADPPAGEASGSASSASMPEPPPEALAALRQAFVHHERIDADPAQPELWIDVAAVAPTFGDAEFARLLVPLAPWVAELSLARSAVGDTVLGELARFPRLVRLDLRATGIGDAGVRALGPAAGLRELNLAQTKLTDAALEALLAWPALRVLELWGTGLTSEALARLRAARPTLRVNAGDEPPAEALESEGPLTFTSDRAVPGAELVPEGLRPVNASCPVSGSPVNPKYALVYSSAGGTRVVGFCCPNCPKEFWIDPTRFEAKLPHDEHD